MNTAILVFFSEISEGRWLKPQNENLTNSLQSKHTKQKEKISF